MLRIDDKTKLATTQIFSLNPMDAFKHRDELYIRLDHTGLIDPEGVDGHWRLPVLKLNGCVVVWKDESVQVDRVDMELTATLRPISVLLTGFTGNKITAIRHLRDLTGLDLKRAKAITDDVEEGKRPVLCTKEIYDAWLDRHEESSLIVASD
jgi:hypothetical protein